MDGLDAPAFVARQARTLRGGSGRAWCGRAGEARRARHGWAGAARRLAALAAEGRVRALAAGGRAGRVRAGTRYLFGSAAPWIRARQSPARQRLALLVAATSALCRATMHGAAQAFSRARAIGAAKSVSLKKSTVLDLKLVFKKC